MNTSVHSEIKGPFLVLWMPFKMRRRPWWKWWGAGNYECSQEVETPRRVGVADDMDGVFALVEADIQNFGTPSDYVFFALTHGRCGDGPTRVAHDAAYRSWWDRKGRLLWWGPGGVYGSRA